VKSLALILSGATVGTRSDRAPITPPEGGTAMDFRPLLESERRQLQSALRRNAEEDRAILLDRRDTSFVGTSQDVPDEEVITAIRSVPCHY
jgi:hypothetical protein